MSRDVPSDFDDPVGYFVDELRFHGKTERTRDAYERVLRRFETFLAGRDSGLSAADRRECMAWVHQLRGKHAPSTVATYAAYLHRFYDYMAQVGAFDSNPMTLVMEEMDEGIDTDPARRDISIPDMRAFVASITHPLERAIVVTLLKTGLRVGELCNLDLRDLQLSGTGLGYFDAVTPRGALDGRTDAMYVSRDVRRGQEVNGEERTASNKRKRSTIIPVDRELHRVLVRWLAVRPDVDSPANPLFVSTKEWGRRVTPAMVRSYVTNHAASAGWHYEGGGPEENVSPHYFRHFFTTHLRDRTGDRGVVKYLRGDVANDVIDTYTHDWGGRVRAVYEENIYELL